MLEDTIDLVEVVRHLRGQLQLAMQAGADEELRFEVEDLELELQVAVTRSADAEAGADAKMKFLVFEIGGGGKVTGSLGSERIQKLKLRLKPTTTRDEKRGTNGVFLSGD
jgi:hypothetical protein